MNAQQFSQYSMPAPDDWERSYFQAKHYGMNGAYLASPWDAKLINTPTPSPSFAQGYTEGLDMLIPGIPDIDDVGFIAGAFTGLVFWIFILIWVSGKIERACKSKTKLKASKGAK